MSLPKFRESKLEGNHSFVFLKTMLITFSEPVKLGFFTITLVLSANCIVLGLSLTCILIVTLGR